MTNPSSEAPVESKTRAGPSGRMLKLLHTNTIDQITQGTAGAIRSLTPHIFLYLSLICGHHAGTYHPCHSQLKDAPISSSSIHCSFAARQFRAVALHVSRSHHSSSQANYKMGLLT